MPERAKSRNTGLIIGIVIFVVLIPCIGLIIGGSFLKGFVEKEGFPMVACSLDLASVSRASLNYAKDHGGKLPAAANWQAELKPYVKKVRDAREDKDMGPIQLMDLDGVWGCKGKLNTAFALNDAVAGKIREELMKDGSDPVMIFETPNVEKNAHGAWKEPDKKNPPRLTGWMWTTVSGKVRTSSSKDGADLDDFEDVKSN